MAKNSQKNVTYGLTFQPRTYQGMLKGIEKLTAAIRPTLGPFPRLVAVQSSFPGKPPDLLDDGGMIARRIIQLPNRDEDIGAMYMRHMLWKVRESCGDGTATAAVLFEEVTRLGIRHIVYGGNAMPLRSYLEKGARIIYDQIGSLACPVSDPSVVAHIAESICYDPAMATALGEVFDTIGEFGSFELRSGQGRGLETEYVNGTYWEGPLHSKTMFNFPLQQKAALKNAAVLITDFAIDDLHHLVRAITEAKKAGKSSLMLICNSISEPCIGFLVADSTRAILPVIAVKTPASRIDEQLAAIEDIAVLTGAQPLTHHAGETLEDVKGSHFGEARSVWAQDQFFGIVGGKGDPRSIRQLYWRLKTRHDALEVGEERTLVRSRIGKLLGGSAILHVGGATEAEIAVRKSLAERTAEAIRGAILKGVVPGGGMALMSCKPALREALASAVDPDESAAYRILINALDIPLRAISANAGISPDEVMAEIKYAGPGSGYDVRSRQITHIERTTLLDSAHVAQTAAYRSITAAALLLTVDVLLHHKKPETVTDT
ncbi:MAG: hypothetical protein IH586_14805 [Anaerolineaceae bacterium]|nr:hypothetical protein [Anaerolineaceae bacterium]